MRETILTNYAFGLAFIKMLVADIPDDRICRQPGGMKNHPAWTLGHTAIAAAFAAKLLSREPPVPEGWNELFGRGSTPVEDLSQYPTKEVLLAGLEELRGVAADAFSAADDAQWSQPMPDEEFRQIMPTVGNGLLFLLTQHEWQHIGELCAWRQAMEMPHVTG